MDTRSATTNSRIRSILLGSKEDSSLSRDFEFFRGLRLANGTCKTTGAGRLQDVDQLVVASLGAARPIRCLDAGASIGVTTIDLLGRLRTSGFEPTCLLVDISISAAVVECFGLTLLVDPTGKILCLEGFNVLQFRPDSNAVAIRSRLGRGLFGLLEGILRRFKTSGGMRRTDVQLVAPEVRASTDIEILEHDLLQPLTGVGTFDVVRAANILNRAYFDDATLRRMTANLINVLDRDGLLVVCRTDETGRTNGSIFQLVDARILQVVARLGEGSEVESLVLEST